MSDYQLAKRRFVEGVWEGILSPLRAGAAEPKIEVTHQGRAVTGVTLTRDPAGTSWNLQVPIPAEVLGDGAQVFLISDAATGDVLESFAIMAGEALAEALRAEVQLLRAELETLKRAFRRHCLQTD